ncbi:MAG TPA: hypothetical protein VMX36_04630 [Sedimentisphaerales bacterium]|nr:hypothetical protein [Sedimentisphaerales bacterium]
MDFNLSDFFNEDGTINADGPGLSTLAGPDHANSQSYKDVKDCHSFVKAAFDTHAKVGKKLDNVIQKPGKDASDADKAAYRASLKAELGAVKSGAEYEFARPEKLPAGMGYDEAMEAQFRELFAKTGMAKDEAKQLYDAYNEYQVARYNTAAKAEAEQIKLDDDQLRVDWPGEKMLTNPRLAYQAMAALGAEAFPKLWNGWTEADGTVIQGLDARLKEAKIFDSPGDLAKWRACGVDTSMLRLYSVIGARMDGAKMLTGDSAGKKTVMAGGKEISEAEQAQVDAANANTDWS